MGYALIIIDMQEDFFKNPVLNQKRHLLVGGINALTAICRNAGVPIIWITQEFEPDLHDAFMIMRENNIYKTIRGTEGCRILSELNRNPKDLHVVKKRYSAFYKTNLEETLNTHGIDTLVLAGINTHACVRMTAVDAYQRDYKVILAKDCIASYDDDFHKESLRYLTGYISEALDNKEIEKIVAGSKF
ncbi:MAG: cysteine hydrolase family protein [Acetivibrionales bacterium]|jgi:nicotinamidase-related amidase